MALGAAYYEHTIFILFYIFIYLYYFLHLYMKLQIVFSTKFFFQILRLSFGFYLNPSFISSLLTMLLLRHRLRRDYFIEFWKQFCDFFTTKFRINFEMFFSTKFFFKIFKLSLHFKKLEFHALNMKYVALSLGVTVQFMKKFFYDFFWNGLAVFYQNF